MNPQAALPTFRVEPGTSIAQALPWLTPAVKLDSPALSVMTDLTQVKAATIAPSASLRQAEQSMIHQGVRMLFVTGDDRAFQGLISATDLSSDRTLGIVGERGVRYDDLGVADAMTPLSLLDAIDHDAMKIATVANVIATLKRFGRDHLLVVERDGPQTPRRVRGVISRAQIERQLGQTITLTPIAHSFSEIERALV